MWFEFHFACTTSHLLRRWPEPLASDWLPSRYLSALVFRPHYSRRSTFAVMSGAPEISLHTSGPEPLSSFQPATIPPPERGDADDSFWFNQVCASLVARQDPTANSEDFQAGRGDPDITGYRGGTMPPRQTGPRTSVAPDEFSIFI